ncbi:MAG: DUF4317 domain-containing protein [Eubacterium sp.]|nr:DUF4317 domain-containing protein [Eubacterium sp.]
MKNVMNKKEINEIKSLFDTVQDAGIRRLAGCYVNGEKQKVKTFVDAFLNLPEEEMYKYLEIFRRTFSGTQGKNLLDMSFDEKDGVSEGRTLLKRLRDSDLDDEEALNEFFDKVIANYEYVGNYLILLINQDYDVPNITTDGIEMEDASEEVYRYILCSICPMKLTKPGLGFDDDLGEIHTLKQIFAVDLPDTGFLFPAYNDRSSDEDAALYFTRKTDEQQEKLLENVLNLSFTIPAKQQKEDFTGLVNEVLGDEKSFETVFAIQENLKEAVKNKKQEAPGETVVIDRKEIKNIFEDSGVSEEKLKTFDEKYEKRFDREEIVAENVAPVRNFEVKNANMVLRVSSKRTDIIETKIVDGKKCLVIELTDDLTVNGIPVKDNQ